MTKSKTLTLKENGGPVNGTPENGNSKANGGTLFAQITTGVARLPRRTMLYGVQGVGKSTWAANAPKPIFLPTEEGLNDIDCAKFPTLTTYQGFMQAMRDVYHEDHSFKTIVIDSLDWLERMIWERVCVDSNKKDIKDIADFGYGQGYKLALGYWNKVVEALSAIRTHRDMQTILVAHCAVERFEDPEFESYDRYTPKLHRSASGLIMEWCDEVLFACYELHVKTTQEKFNAERRRAIGTGQRIVRTSERPFARAKNRLRLPDELPLDYNVYAEYLNGTHNQ